MFCYEEEAQKKAAPKSRLIRALDTTVAFATLESYGVIDARQERRRSTGRPAPRNHPAAGCPGRRREAHTGRPRPATAAGRLRHHAARKRIERMGSR